MSKLNNLADNLKRMGTMYLLLFLAIFYIVFLDPSIIINCLHVNPVRYHEIFHLPKNSVAQIFWDNYKGINENKFIYLSTVFGTLCLTIISASKSIVALFSFESMWNTIKSFTIVLLSATICYVVSSLASVSLFSKSSLLATNALSIISVFGVLSLITIAMAMDKTIDNK